MIPNIKERVTVQKERTDAAQPSFRFKKLPAQHWRAGSHRPKKRPPRKP